MIAYIELIGLGLFKEHKFRIPARKYGWYAGIWGDKRFDGRLGAKYVRVVPLNLKQLISDAKHQHAPGGFGDAVGRNLRPPDDRHKRAYLIIRFKSNGWGLQETDAIEFFVDSLRMFSGAAIEAGSIYCFNPTKGRWRPSKPAGTVVYPQPPLRLSPGLLLKDANSEQAKRFLNLNAKLRDAAVNMRELKVSHRYFCRGMGIPIARSGTSPEDRILFLTIALEALFSPPSKTELSYRVAEHAAFFLGGHQEHIDRIFRIVRIAYSIRSDVAHGAFKDFAKYEKKFPSLDFPYDFISEISYLVRKAIVGVSALQMRSPKKTKDEYLVDLGCAIRGANVSYIPVDEPLVIKHSVPEENLNLKWLDY